MKGILLTLVAAVALACGAGKTPILLAPDAPENCFTPAGNICMTVSSVTITCVDLPPGSERNCSASVPMNIPSLVTGSRISVGVGNGGADYISTTIVTVPNTAPGSFIAQVPSAKLASGCTNGASSHVVGVYDGNHPTSTANGGRPLYVASVPTTMSCSH